METVCAWCHKGIGSAAGEGPRVSHGICRECVTFLRSNKPGRSLRDFLDTLPAPVLAVDGGAHVQVVNTAAETMIGRPRETVEGQLGGDVLECAYARLPEGCGSTVHCKACTIRRTVMETHETGQERRAVTSVQQIHTPQGPQAQRFVISTRKYGDLVLLRVDEGAPEPEPPTR